MKPKKPLRSVIAVLLVVSSICSYIYLNTYSSIQPSVLEEVQQTPSEQKDSDSDKKIAFPEVRVVHKVVRGISRLVPASY
jgi:hypothetical protein